MFVKIICSIQTNKIKDTELQMQKSYSKQQFYLYACLYAKEVNPAKQKDMKPV